VAAVGRQPVGSADALVAGSAAIGRRLRRASTGGGGGAVGRSCEWRNTLLRLVRLDRRCGGRWLSSRLVDCVPGVHGRAPLTAWPHVVGALVHQRAAVRHVVHVVHVLQRAGVPLAGARALACRASVGVVCVPVHQRTAARHGAQELRRTAVPRLVLVFLLELWRALMRHGEHVLERLRAVVPRVVLVLLLVLQLAAVRRLFVSASSGLRLVRTAVRRSVVDCWTVYCVPGVRCRPVTARPQVLFVLGCRPRDWWTVYLLLSVELRALCDHSSCKCSGSGRGSAPVGAAARARARARAPAGCGAEAGRLSEKWTAACEAGRRLAGEHFRDLCIVKVACVVVPRSRCHPRRASARAPAGGGDTVCSAARVRARAAVRGVAAAGVRGPDTGILCGASGVRFRPVALSVSSRPVHELAHKEQRCPGWFPCYCSSSSP